MSSILIVILRYVWCKFHMASPLVHHLKKALSPRSPIMRLKSPFKKHLPRKSPLLQKKKSSFLSPHVNRAFQRKLFLDGELSPAVTNVSVKVPTVRRVLALEHNVESLLERGIDEMNYYVLGKGSFGTVILSNLKGERVAVKIVKNNNQESSMLGELNALILSHPNIVDVLQVIHNDDKPNGIVVMEPWSPLTLQAVVEESIHVSFEDSIRFMIEISDALSYCHEVGIVHLDVKPKNILIDLNDMRSKLCDFGSSLSLKCSSVAPHFRGTVAYIAPELLRGKSVTEKCDLYSLGITMWQILHKENAYSGIENHVIIYQVVKNRFRPKTNSQNRSEVKGFIKLYERCWHEDPLERPTAGQIATSLKSMLKNS